MKQSPDYRKITELSTSSNVRIVFSSVRKDAGVYGDIRKWVNTAKYSGPTRSGIQLSVENLQYLSNLGAKIISDEKFGGKSGQLGELKLGEKSKIVVSATEYQKSDGLNIREWIETQSYSGWTKRGLWVRRENTKNFFACLETLLQHVVHKQPAKPKVLQLSQKKEDRSEMDERLREQLKALGVF